jgi:large subunit ribosomal protein L25
MPVCERFEEFLAAMRKDITLVAEPRTLRGKNEARRLRVKGFAPAIMYGAEKDAVAVAVSPKEVNKILRSSTGHNTIFNLAVKDGETTPVMIVDWQHDPIKENLLHIDLKRIDPNKRMTVKIPVHVHGEATGVKLQGGLLEIAMREVEVECLPDDIPEAFNLDVRELGLNQAVRANQLPLTNSMKLLTVPEAVIVHIVAPKAEVAAAVEEEVAAKTAEPEVIKKGKKEDEAAAPAAGDKKKK